MELTNEEFEKSLKGFAVVDNYSARLESLVMKSIDDFTMTKYERIYFKHSFYRSKVDHERKKEYNYITEEK